MEPFEEFVQHAISLEEEAAELYGLLANRAQSPEIKKTFLEMAAQEAGHKKQLQQVLAKGQFPKGNKFTPDDDLKIADYVVDVDIRRDDLSYEEALIIGMKLEKASLDIYQHLAQSVESGELRDLFAFLAAEEAKHKHNFEAKFDDLQ